jgi:CheY-like chemotaxis protein
VERVRTILLLDSDLFFVVKVTETLKHAGYATTTARDDAAFARALAESPPAVALVNMAARGVDFRRAIHLARDAGVPVIAFGPHVDLQAQEEARHAGATRVVANAKLASDLPGLLERTLLRAPAGDEPATDAD